MDVTTSVCACRHFAVSLIRRPRDLTGRRGTAGPFLLYRNPGGLMPNDQIVDPIASLEDAQERLRIAAAQLFVASEWLGRNYKWNSRVDRWCAQLDRLGNDARSMVHTIRAAGEDHDEDG